MEHLEFALDLREPHRHRVGITLTLDPSRVSPDRSPSGQIELFLAAWTPGSYLIREFCRHIDDFRATAIHQGGASSSDSPLPAVKSSKNRFRVDLGGAAGLIKICYTVYCHELTVRTSDATDQHAFLSGASIFLWPVGLGDFPVELRVALPEGWELATALTRAPPEPDRTRADDIRLRACGLDELIDSPILAGMLETLSFTAVDRPHSLVLDGLDGIEPPESLVPDTIAIIEAAAAIFGGTVPYQEYKFLCMFADSGRGGLEHLTSAVLLAPRTGLRPPKQYREFMGLVAHEFFHVWNVKRMRPAELWEFDYEVENYTDLLWVAEGFTAYYDDHLCRRAGVLTTRQYLDVLGQTITELQRTPGRQHQSLAQASFDAWIRLYRPDENTRNSTLSYYGNGALVALCLDLRIRAETEDRRCLDDVMRTLYAGTFAERRGYTHADVVNALSEAAGGNMEEFVDALVHRPLQPDFESLFEPFGIRLSERRDSTPYLGVQFKSGSTALASVLEGSPAANAGLSPGDEILALDGLRVTSPQWSGLFESVARVDCEVEILLARRGRILTRNVTPSSPPAGQITLVVMPDSTPAQDRLRSSWLFEPSLAGSTLTCTSSQG